ncbi:MAG: AmmeMemoRadiSam system protein A [Pseudomonadota bacterium]|nr:AmmeMemoRadiSam system protein A [Pseudomonadota bacterium]MDP1903615.1 AmmeMemoRadiSam system protein A [Pseudomonadota bacterium]MDP2353917.1 AmmeMemoRadiSam system protein A [Pseudomonadota bacterium]
MFTEEQGRLMLTLARAAIARELDVHAAPPPHPTWLDETGAVFVTLTEAGRLRGCIGSLTAHRSLGADLEHNARAAAFRDPRFPALSQAELARVRVEVSVLTPATTMTFMDEADALAQLRPGVDGVILEYGHHRSTFLPQVWEQLPDPRLFMSQLKQKAGLSGDFWDKDVRLSRYGVEKFKEDLA